MKSLDTKLIIYDSNCKVCSSLRDLVLKFTTIPENKIKPLKDLPKEFVGHVDTNRFRNVMALIDTRGGETLYGAEGIAYIFSSQYKVLDFLLSIRPIFLLFNFLYKTQAYNRYVIATPRSNFKCDCLPDRVVKYRVSYIVITMLISVLLYGLIGVSVKNFLPEVTSFTILFSTVISTVFVGLVASGGKILDYIGHVSSVLIVGGLLMLPWLLCAAFGFYQPIIFWTNVGVSCIYVIYLHFLRMKYLEIRQSATIIWAITFGVSVFSLTSF